MSEPAPRQAVLAMAISMGQVVESGTSEDFERLRQTQKHFSKKKEPDQVEEVIF